MYAMEKQRNRLVPVDTLGVRVEAQLDTVAAGVLVGESDDAFDDADADDTAVAAADDTAVAAADDMADVAVVLVGKLADADETAVAEGADREE